MGNLNQDYIIQHLAGVQTYESFGRTIVNYILDVASQNVVDGSESIKVPLTFEVIENVKGNCIDINCDGIRIFIP